METKKASAATTEKEKVEFIDQTPQQDTSVEHPDLDTVSNLNRQSQNLGLETVGVTDIDRLDTAESAPIDLMSDYWTPENVGETKRMIFDRIGFSHVLVPDTGELIELDCAFFYYKDNGIVKQIRNGSKRLVGAIQAYNIQRGAALEIKYIGKKTNRTNSFKSDNWSIRPLVLQLQAK